MLQSKDIQDLREEMAGIRSLLLSEDWIHWVTFLRKERKPSLQKKINLAIEKGEFVQAQCLLTLLNDCNMQIDLFKNSVKTKEDIINKKET